MQPVSVIQRACRCRPVLSNHQQQAVFSAWSSPASWQLALLRLLGAVAGNTTYTLAGTTATKTSTGQRSSSSIFPSGATTRMASRHRHITNGSPSVNRLANIAGHLLAPSATRSYFTSSPIPPSAHRTVHSAAASLSPTMSTQSEHPTLLIPGPIEFDDAVLQSMSHYRFVWSR